MTVEKIANSPNIRIEGDFLVGTTAVFFFTFPNIDGELYDPSDIDITIYDPDGVEYATGESADKLGTGQYAFSWDIPATATPGLYLLQVDFVQETGTGPTTNTFSEEFVVTEAEPETPAVDPRLLAFRMLLESFLGYSQRIPVFNEIGRLDTDREIAEFSFPRWNQPAGALVFVNGTQTDMAHTVDFQKGKISFTNALSQYDEVTVNYNFRWFTDNEIDDFMHQSIEVFNQYTPHTVYTMFTIPPRYVITTIQQAAIFSLRRLILDLHYQEPAKIFGGLERAEKLIGSLDSLKKNYEDEVTKLYEMKKYGPYLGLTKTVTVPEYTLPGGRSRWFRYLFKGG